MNSNKNAGNLPPLVANIVQDASSYIDNTFADAWKQLGFSKLIEKSGFKKRSGIDVAEVVYLLLVWKWLNIRSIAMFSRDAIGMFSHANKDTMYELLHRQDINWRKLNTIISRRIYKTHELDKSKVRAFVLDDSIKVRRGKHMEGVSSHFDHVTNTHVMGEQVLTLGLATEDTFLPLDSELSISQSKVHPLRTEFSDARSVVAQRYHQATNWTKIEIAAAMMSRANAAGIKANYLLADAWFGNKAMVRTAREMKITAILRMKKGNLKYRIKVNGRYQDLDAKELFSIAVRKKWVKVRDLPWKCVELQVEVDLNEKKKGVRPDYQSIKLLFVRGIKEPDDTDGSAKNWALFLSSDPEMSSSKMLQTYAMRWSIEVYFKEAKQHLGFLKEQTISFASHIASIHLCAIRYLVLIHTKLQREEVSVGFIRSEIQEQMDSINFATRLWKIFRAIISGTLQSLREELGLPVKEIMSELDRKIEEFFIKSLQLDSQTMQLEFE